MNVLTKPQQLALRHLWTRLCNDWHYEPVTEGSPPSYRAYRRQVQPTVGMDGAVVVPFANMWVCIETDGYRHT